MAFGLKFMGLVIAVLSLAGPAMAQAESGAAAGCEIHVWPGNGLRSVFHGWFHGGIVDGAVTGRDGYPPVPADPIDTKVQHDALAALDLPALAGLPGYKVVLHENALSSAVIRGTPGRIAADSAPCYAELVIDDVFLQQDFVEGTKLRSLIRFRNFGTGAVPIRTFGVFAQTGLKIFPPALPQNNAAALAEIRTAFGENVRVFSGYLLKPAKGKAR